MDADILAADAETRDRLRLQEDRDHRKAVRAFEQKRVDELVDLIDIQQRQEALLVAPRQEIRLAIVKAIAINFMKPTSGYMPDTIAADTLNDANRLRAAVDAVERIIMETPSLGPTPGAL